MFTKSKIFIPKKVGERAYLSYYYNGKRLREYNGSRLNFNINPNHCEDVKDRKRLLEQLQFEFTKALNKGWNPFDKELEIPTLKEALNLVLAEKLSSNLCDLYKRNLKAVGRMFVDFDGWKGKSNESDQTTITPSSARRFH